MSHITLDLAPALRAHREQDVDTCLAEISPILEYVPHHPVALHLKAWAMSKQGRKAEALEILSEVISKNPRLVPARAEYGEILMSHSRHAEALKELAEAHRLQPDRDAVIVKYCICLIKNHRSGEAERLLMDLLKRSPKDVSARFALAIAFLQQGKWAQGFSQYRIRFWFEGIDQDLIRDEATLWKGELLSGKTLLIQCEQGYGDQILFIRYANWVKQTFNPAKIVVSAKPEMASLLASAYGVDEVVTDLKEAAYDLHVPLLNLPLLHKTTPETIPFANDRYLGLSADRLKKWERVFAGDRDKIAICWRTNLISDEHSQSIDHEKRVKSLSCDEAEQLCYQLRSVFPKARLLSLQPGANPEEKEMMARCGIENVWNWAISDFADTAAIIEQMDLVVSIDTGIAHLAGALARPVWNLLPHYSDWRWSQDDEYSSWYPDMRLFRQSEENNWMSLDSDNRVKN
ncbi:MAG: tetratricopeptide repeat protein [Verrucomicrobiales bacterium]|nr:tetratricopeptide repeat protein [Verrucomicrobiales bacterium]